MTAKWRQPHKHWCYWLRLWRHGQSSQRTFDWPARSHTSEREACVCVTVPSSAMSAPPSSLWLVRSLPHHLSVTLRSCDLSLRLKVTDSLLWTRGRFMLFLFLMSWRFLFNLVFRGGFRVSVICLVTYMMSLISEARTSRICYIVF